MNIDDVKYHLKRPNSDSKTSIFARVYVNKLPFKYYIGKSIESRFWDFDRNSPISNKTELKKLVKKNPGLGVELRNIVTKMRKCQDAIVSYVSQKELEEVIVQHEDLKLFLNKRFNEKGKIKKKHYLNKYVEKFISDSLDGIRLTPNKRQYGIGTIKNYKGFLIQLMDYQENRKTKLTFDMITIEFYNDFVKFFQKKKYSPNTIGRHVKNLKSIMKYAKNDGFHSNDIYKHEDFKVLREKVDSIYLTQGEINKIEAVTLDKYPKLDLVRDVFLLGCYTGLRYSDFCRIDKHHVNFEKRYLSIHNMKTDKKTIVPLKREAWKILEKYHFQIPKTFEQKVNRDIKLIGKMAGINQEVERIELKGPVKEKTIRKKYELITTHTARRSAVTNMLKAGLSRGLIMKITGHSSEKHLNAYLRISNEEAAELMEKNSYFSE